MDRSELQKAVADLIRKADLSEPEFIPAARGPREARQPGAGIGLRMRPLAFFALLPGYLPGGPA